MKVSLQHQDRFAGMCNGMGMVMGKGTGMGVSMSTCTGMGMVTVKVEGGIGNSTFREPSPRKRLMELQAAYAAAGDQQLCSR